MPLVLKPYEVPIKRYLVDDIDVNKWIVHVPVRYTMKTVTDVNMTPEDASMQLTLAAAKDGLNTGL